jgi:serine/threonine protein kinase
LVLISNSSIFSDFGLSRTLSTQKGEDLTEYVVTRYYRAPEIMLSSHEYAQSVDMWSAGCTLGEVLTGKILFPGQHYIEQINLILNLRGTPDAETRKLISNEYALKYVESLPEKPKVPLAELIPGAPPEALDLLDRMLDLNPNTRITINEALEHPFLASLHDDEDEPVFQGSFDFSFEADTTLDLTKVQRLIMK